MLKITAIVSLVLIGGALLTAGMTCNSCGSECASACGTKHFRSCCFNYLRKKRGSEDSKLWTPTHEIRNKNEHLPKSKLPTFLVENIPDNWLNSIASNDFEPYPFEDALENRLQIVYDA